MTLFIPLRRRRTAAILAEEISHFGAITMPVSADRNLLFGILALQMDFITRDQLVAALHAWVLAKHRPLGEILVEQKAMPSA